MMTMMMITDILTKTRKRRMVITVIIKVKMAMTKTIVPLQILGPQRRGVALVSFNFFSVFLATRNAIVHDVCISEEV